MRALSSFPFKVALNVFRSIVLNTVLKTVLTILASTTVLLTSSLAEAQVQPEPEGRPLTTQDFPMIAQAALYEFSQMAPPEFYHNIQGYQVMKTEDGASAMVTIYYHDGVQSLQMNLYCHSHDFETRMACHGM